MSRIRRLALAGLLALPTIGHDVSRLGAEEAVRSVFFPDLAIGELSETRDRPLFSPTRRPPEESMVAASAPAPAPSIRPPSVRLIGLLLGQTELALIEQSGGEILRLAPGAELDAWTLSIVDSRTVAFEREGRRESYMLFER